MDILIGSVLSILVMIAVGLLIYDLVCVYRNPFPSFRNSDKRLAEIYKDKNRSYKTRSILKARVIRVNRLIPNLPIELLMAKEYLAFYVAVSIVENYKRDLTGNEDYILDLFPETYIENEGFDSYIQNTCKALFYIKRYEIKDIFAYANLFFWLEKYTDVKIGIET